MGAIGIFGILLVLLGVPLLIVCGVGWLVLEFLVDLCRAILGR